MFPIPEISIVSKTGISKGEGILLENGTGGFKITIRNHLHDQAWSQYE